MDSALLAASSVTPLEIAEALNWRYATKVFDPGRKVLEEDMDLLTEALRLSPSSIGMQPWMFFVVKDVKLRQELRKAAVDQPQVTDASHLLVLCSRKEIDADYFDRVLALEQRELRREVTPLKTFRPVAVSYIESMSIEQRREWMAEQVYIALGFLLSACAMLRIDACPMEAFDRDQADKVLGLDKYGVTSRTLVTIGYRSSRDHHAQDKKVRFPKSEIVVTI
jgi:nitroreductase